MHSSENNKLNLESFGDSRVDQSFIHEHEREIKKILKLIDDFRNKIIEDFSSGKRSDWMDAFNNNFTSIFCWCSLIGIADEECSNVIKFKIEVENKIVSENREINKEEKEKICELVERIGVVLDSILK